MEKVKRLVLVIDDEKALCESISDYLEDMGYSSAKAFSGEEGLKTAETIKPDAVITDLNMPGIGGLELVKIFSEKSPQMPVIILSGAGLLEKAIQAMRNGAWDYLSKPLESFSLLELCLNRCFERARLLTENINYQKNLEIQVQKKTEQILRLNQGIIDTQKEIILKMGDLVETRSHETAGHVTRVSEYAYLLAKAINLSEEECSRIRMASPMHDIGKIGIPDQILIKPGALTPEERSVILNHTIIGYSIFRNSCLPVLKLASTIARWHHERWDGKGYPDGLGGQSIPIEARITCLADILDALSHHRIYKEAWSMDKTLQYILEEQGGIFEPVLVEALMDNLTSFLHVFDEYGGEKVSNK